MYVSFTIFEIIVRIRGLDINNYKSIIGLGNICMDYVTKTNVI